MPGSTLFISYARNDLTSYMKDFMRDLIEAVRGRVTLGAGDKIAFKDTQDIDIGDPWPEVLIDDLRTSKVMVMFYTPNYFTRPVCGQEVQAFLDRQAQAPKEQRFMLPIWWIPPDQVPDSLEDFNYYHEDLPEAYKLKGLEVITRKRSGDFRDAYQDCLVALADRIATASKQMPGLPGLAPALDLAALRNAFAAAAPAASTGTFVGSGPDSVNFVYVAGTKNELAAKPQRWFYGDTRPDQWAPFDAGKLRVGLVASEVAVGNKFFPSKLDLDQSIVNHVKSAEAANAILVLIVDTWTIHYMPQFQAWMQSFDQYNSLNTAVIVVWNEGDLDVPTYEQILKSRLRVTFKGQSTREEIFFRPEIRCSKEFKNALTDTLIRIQDKIIQSQQALEIARQSPYVRKPELANA